MDQTEQKIIDASVRTFIHYGAKKTAMADIARAAGVSRQTLYDLFGSKDELIVASIRHVTNENLKTVREGTKKKRGLKAKLTVYFESVTIKSFRQFLEAGDPLDILSGHNEAGRNTLTESRSRHSELIEELLLEFDTNIRAKGQTPKELAELIVHNAMSLKYGPANETELRRVIATLTTSIMAMVEG